ncbi:hypothetical protein L4D09_13150 [Photobacterium makurazakiensis]|uniref:hypothetical protein n=1 Tax=Photobacterium makurazakiensis TaxID=2910234 RepID=UPI003D11B029
MKTTAISLLIFFTSSVANAGYGYSEGDLLGSEEITIYGEHTEGYDTSGFAAAVCSLGIDGDNAGFYWPGISRKVEAIGLNIESNSSGNIDLSVKMNKITEPKERHVSAMIQKGNVVLKAGSGEQLLVNDFYNTYDGTSSFTEIKTYAGSPSGINVADTLTLFFNDTSYYKRMLGNTYEVSLDLQILCW